MDSPASSGGRQAGEGAREGSREPHVPVVGERGAWLEETHAAGLGEQVPGGDLEPTQHTHTHQSTGLTAGDGDASLTFGKKSTPVLFQFAPADGFTP